MASDGLDTPGTGAQKHQIGMPKIRINSIEQGDFSNFILQF